MSNPFLNTPLEAKTDTPIQEGDAGVILRKDGTFSIFNCHEQIDPNQLTELQVNQGAVLHAFSTALRTPVLMQFLMEQAALFDASLSLDSSRH